MYIRNILVTVNTFAKRIATRQGFFSNSAFELPFHFFVGEKGENLVGSLSLVSFPFVVPQGVKLVPRTLPSVSMRTAQRALRCSHHQPRAAHTRKRNAVYSASLRKTEISVKFELVWSAVDSWYSAGVSDFSEFGNQCENRETRTFYFHHSSLAKTRKLLPNTNTRIAKQRPWPHRLEGS